MSEMDMESLKGMTPREQIRELTRSQGEFNRLTCGEKREKINRAIEGLNFKEQAGKIKLNEKIVRSFMKGQIKMGDWLSKSKLGQSILKPSAR